MKNESKLLLRLLHHHCLLLNNRESLIRQLILFTLNSAASLFSHIIEKLAESVTNIHVEKKTYTVNQSHLSYIAFSLCHIMGSK